jgi:hypothetical protein
MGGKRRSKTPSTDPQGSQPNDTAGSTAPSRAQRSRLISWRRREFKRKRRSQSNTDSPPSATKTDSTYTTPEAKGSTPQERKPETASKTPSISSLSGTTPRRAIIVPDGGLNPDLSNPKEASNGPIVGLSATANDFVPGASFHTVKQLLPPTTSVAKEFVPSIGSHTVSDMGTPDKRIVSPTNSLGPSLSKFREEVLALDEFNAITDSWKRSAEAKIKAAIGMRCSAQCHTEWCPWNEPQSGHSQDGQRREGESQEQFVNTEN